VLGGVGRKGIAEGEEAKLFDEERRETDCRGEETALPPPCKEEMEDFFFNVGVADRGSGPLSELELRRSCREGEDTVLPFNPLRGEMGDDSGRAVLLAPERESRLKESDIAASLFGTGGKGGEWEGVCRRLEGDGSPLILS
jgi:hypothetical protein